MRAKRSNPSAYEERMDCFVAFAPRNDVERAVGPLTAAPCPRSRSPSSASRSRPSSAWRDPILVRTSALSGGKTATSDNFLKGRLRMTITDQPRASQNAALDKERLRRKYLEERDKRLRADGNDQYLEPTGQFAHYLDDPYTPVTPREPQTDHVTVRLHRRRLRRARHRRAAEGGRHRRRPHHREGRRLRRHLVLEPLPGRAVRHRVDDLPAAARRDRPHADGEVRARARDPRALPAHRQAVRPLRQRAVPHRGHEPRVGRGAIALDHPHQPRRRVHRAVRRHGHRAAARAEAARHPRHRDLRGPLVPHQPLGLRLHRRRPDGRADGEAGRQARRHHRHRRHRRCSASRISRAPARSSTCSSARRRRSTSATTTPIDPGVVRRSRRRAGSSAGW